MRFNVESRDENLGHVVRDEVSSGGARPRSSLLPARHRPQLHHHPASLIPFHTLHIPLLKNTCGADHKLSPAHTQ